MAPPPRHVTFSPSPSPTSSHLLNLLDCLRASQLTYALCRYCYFSRMDLARWSIFWVLVPILCVLVLSNEEMLTTTPCDAVLSSAPSSRLGFWSGLA
ncbi:hypothetical protein R3P38DRAFT_3242851 [Favolaschia claudopus]|uniref:Uncharacterized protein n=1 Tax=Favolaschia claudopus TaxID=2862362 RepID=A0AAV9Z5D1_9AGAR